MISELGEKANPQQKTAAVSEQREVYHTIILYLLLNVIINTVSEITESKKKNKLIFFQRRSFVIIRSMLHSKFWLKMKAASDRFTSEQATPEHRFSCNISLCNELN